MDERERILTDAHEKSAFIIEQAREERSRLLSRAEVVQAAEDEAKRIVMEAQHEAEKLAHQADDYVDQKMADVEIILNKLLRTIGRRARATAAAARSAHRTDRTARARRLGRDLRPAAEHRLRRPVVTLGSSSCEPIPPSFSTSVSSSSIPASGSRSRSTRPSRICGPGSRRCAGDAPLRPGPRGASTAGCSSGAKLSGQYVAECRRCLKHDGHAVHASRAPRSTGPPTDVWEEGYVIKD